MSRRRPSIGLACLCRQMQARCPAVYVAQQTLLAACVLPSARRAMAAMGAPGARMHHATSSILLVAGRTLWPWAAMAKWLASRWAGKSAVSGAAASDAGGPAAAEWAPRSARQRERSLPFFRPAAQRSSQVSSLPVLREWLSCAAPDPRPRRHLCKLAPPELPACRWLRQTGLSKPLRGEWAGPVRWWGTPGAI